MTCIVGLVAGPRVLLGADSAAVGGHHLQLRRKPKAFRRGDVLIAYTSSFRMGDLLAYALVLPERPSGADLDQWMRVDFINAVRECLKQGGYAELHNSAERAGTFLVGVPAGKGVLLGRLFKVDSDYQVGESLDGFDAAGCGEHYALGSLAASETMRLGPERRVEMALTAAARFSGGVRAPFHLIGAGPKRRR